MKKYIASYKICRYPNNGFGSKNSQFYLMDQLGTHYDFINEYDHILDERFWTIELPAIGQFNGETIDEIIEILKVHDVKVTKW